MSACFTESILWKFWCVLQENSKKKLQATNVDTFSKKNCRNMFKMLTVKGTCCAVKIATNTYTRIILSAHFGEAGPCYIYPCFIFLCVDTLSFCRCDTFQSVSGTWRQFEWNFTWLIFVVFFVDFSGEYTQRYKLTLWTKQDGK